MHIIRIASFLLFLPFLVKSQSNLTGIWKLEDTRSVSGPEYDNGVPKVIKIEQSANTIKIETTSAIGDKDTTEKAELELDGKALETITPGQRKKVVHFTWNKDNEAWVWQIDLSAKNEHTKPEIKIVGSFQLFSSNNDKLTYMKTYDGADVPGGNEDYSMIGNYERTTPEKLANDTATGQGVNFTEGLTWEQILIKAKTENKYIFVDCYATWCVPCKKMDKEVYILNRIGEAVNNDFISIKIQVDSSKKDNEFVRMTYPIAREFEKEYHISALPTYLFFDASGNAVHKNAGACSANDFLKIVKDARNPSVQIYSQIKAFKFGQLSFSQMAELANKLKEEKYAELEIANQVARKYFEGYLFKLDNKTVFTKQNLAFFIKFINVISSKDKIFTFLLNNSELVDSLSGNGKGFSKRVTDYIITKEEIEPSLKKAKATNVEPDWQSLERNITRKYSKELSFTTITNAKVEWYRSRKEWKLYCENLVLQVGMSGDLAAINWLRLNDVAYEIFKHSNDKRQLSKAVVWINAGIQNQLKDTALLNDPYLPNRIVPWSALLDTYANLLYKLGKQKEALKFYREKIMSVEPDHPDYLEVYNKMKKGVPTWPETDEKKDQKQ